MFIKAPEATAEQIAGTALCPHLSGSISLSLARALSCSSCHSSSLSLALLHSPLARVPLFSSCRQGKPLTSWPVSLSASQRALPITIWFFSWGSAQVFPLHQRCDVPAGVKPIHMSEVLNHFHLLLWETVWD